MIVAAGATLVIGTGEMGGDEKVLEEFTSVALGDVKSNSGALLENMMRVPSYRTLYMQGNTYPLVMADGAPIVVESRLGMGRIRVLAVKLNTLTSNPITIAALTIDEQPQEQLYQWLDMSMPPLNSPPRLLRNQFWLLLLLIPILFGLCKGRVLYISVASITWVLFAIVQSPLHPATIINQAHQLYLPLGQGALVLGQVDISSYLKGARSELAYPMQFALISAETEGACLVHDFQKKHVRSWWILDSEVGKRQRFKYIAYVDSIPRNDDRARIRSIPKWPAGPWSSVPLQPLSPISQDLPLTSDLKNIKAWRLPSSPPFSAPEPLVLTEDQQY